jgi:hypothetical protein
MEIEGNGFQLMQNFSFFFHSYVIVLGKINGVQAKVGFAISLSSKSLFSTPLDREQMSEICSSHGR